MCNDNLQTCQLESHISTDLNYDSFENDFDSDPLSFAESVRDDAKIKQQMLICSDFNTDPATLLKQFDLLIREL